jgi:soluble lytic murein transglycosylase-like protein
LGLKTDDKQIHDQLFTLLIDSRYKLVEALAHPQNGSGADPVRLLFLEVWGRLGAIIRDAAARDLLGDQTLEFLSLISAGDALVAFDQAAPALGMRISEADLRQLAHIMAPSVTTNPLKFGFEEDPVLRSMFGLREPLTSPGPLETTEGELAAPAETPAVSAPASPTASPSPPATPSGGPTALRKIWRAIARLRDWPRFDVAYAGDAHSAEILAIGKRLNRKLPDRNNLESYRGDVGRLLELIAKRQMDEGQLERKYSDLYQAVVRTTAWQESCWRQWVRRDNRITWLESSTGDIGLMQINKYVWRGLLNVQRLKYDEVYNAGVGCQILGDLMQRRAPLRKLGSKASPEFARSIYSAYNAGPSSYDRWRDKNVPADQHEIDLAFWAKYQALERGEDVAILECVEQREPDPGN